MIPESIWQYVKPRVFHWDHRKHDAQAWTTKDTGIPFSKDEAIRLMAGFMELEVTDKFLRHPCTKCKRSFLISWFEEKDSFTVYCPQCGSASKRESISWDRTDD